MYDGDVTAFGSPGRRAYRHARFPTKDIVTPIVLLYGDRDSLVDIQKMLKELPHHMTVKRLAWYVHRLRMLFWRS
jgi:lysosomal acid lipase/cholesteryl ester hydrolase